LDQGVTDRASRQRKKNAPPLRTDAEIKKELKEALACIRIKFRMGTGAIARGSSAHPEPGVQSVDIDFAKINEAVDTRLGDDSIKSIAVLSGFVRQVDFRLIELRNRWYNLATHLYSAGDIATIPPPGRISDLREPFDSIQERRDRVPERVESAIPRPDKGGDRADKPRTEKSKRTDSGNAKSDKKAKTHCCGIVCENHHACVEATSIAESTILRSRLVILKSNNLRSLTEIYMVRELKGNKYLFPQDDSDTSANHNTETDGFEELAMTLAEDRLNLNINRTQLQQLHYERTKKRVSSVKVNVKVLTFLLVLTDEQIVSIPEGHVTTHEISDPVNGSDLPYDLHLFRHITWFDAYKNEDGLSANGRLTDSFLRTCTEAVVHVKKYNIDISTDAVNSHGTLYLDEDWPVTAKFADVRRLLLPSADQSQIKTAVEARTPAVSSSDSDSDDSQDSDDISEKDSADQGQKRNNPKHQTIFTVGA
jgi:hypothetical protein